MWCEKVYTRVPYCRYMRLRKHGNSLVVSVPSQALRILRWGEGDELELVREDDHLIVRKIDMFDMAEKPRQRRRR